MSYSLQKPNEPLYPDIIWNKPETKALAGKLLIIGGNVHSITAPSTAYSLALDAGAGEVKVIMPDATKRYFAHTTVPHDIVFAASTPSGSFSNLALDDLLRYIEWADFVVIAGDVSKNSETAMLFLDLITKMNTPICITGDALEAFAQGTNALLNRNNTWLVPSFAMLQKISINSDFKKALTSTMLLKTVAEWLIDFTGEHQAGIIVAQHNNIYTAMTGQVIVTTPATHDGNWELRASITATVWAVQKPNAEFKAIATSVTLPLH